MPSGCWSQAGASPHLSYHAALLGGPFGSCSLITISSIILYTLEPTTHQKRTAGKNWCLPAYLSFKGTKHSRYSWNHHQNAEKKNNSGLVEPQVTAKVVLKNLGCLFSLDFFHRLKGNDVISSLTVKKEKDFQLRPTRCRPFSFLLYIYIFFFK